MGCPSSLIFPYQGFGQGKECMVCVRGTTRGRTVIFRNRQESPEVLDPILEIPSQARNDLKNKSCLFLCKRESIWWSFGFLLSWERHNRFLQTPPQKWNTKGS